MDTCHNADLAASADVFDTFAHPSETQSVTNNEHRVQHWRIAREYDAGNLPMCFMDGKALSYRMEDQKSFNEALVTLFGIHTGYRSKPPTRPISDLETESFYLEQIVIPAVRMRNRLDEETITRLTDDIRLNGMHNPIVVRRAHDIPATDEFDEAVYLVAGRHRLEACKRLGLDPIGCTVLEGDECEARLFEIGENLNRAELTEAERRQHIAEWVRLTEKVRHRDAPLAGGVQPKDRGYRKAAKELGISEPAVRRAVAAESLPEPIKAAADATGLGTMDRVAVSRAAPEQQAAKVIELAQRRKPTRQVAIADRAGDANLDRVTDSMAAAMADMCAHLPDKVTPVHTPFQAEDAAEGPDPANERWQRSFASFAGDAVSMAAYWDRTFGPEWRKFKLSSDLVTLARQASDAWAEMAEHLSKNQEQAVRTRLTAI